MLAQRRLPAVRIDTVPPPAAEALPRMDVAVIVGFASTGPLHLPVVVESSGQFAAVFGADATLAWDAARGERVQAYLGPAVRAFFANGGRRCWVIRVARSAASEAVWRGLTVAEAASTPDVAAVNRFAIPGMLAVDVTSGALAPAFAQARSEGSWSDACRASSALARQGFIIEWLGAPTSPAIAGQIVVATRFGVRAGDLLQLGDSRLVCAYASVDSIAVSADAGGPLGVRATVQGAFARLTDADLATSSGLPAQGLVDIEGLVTAAPASFLAGGDDVLRLCLQSPVLAGLESGHWARWVGPIGTVWLRIDDVEMTPAPSTSPPRPDAVIATLAGPAWRELGPMLPVELAAASSAQVLSFDMQVTDGTDSTHLGGLGLTPTHATPWWAQQSDADFYAARDSALADGSVPLPPLTDVRYPLCRATGAAERAWLPLGVDALFGASSGALPRAGTPLQRDGLARFDAELFVDPELASCGIDTLIAQADNIRFTRAQTRTLFGLHAAVSIGVGGLFNEASLIAVPDAVHLGWQPRGLPSASDGDRPDALPTPLAWTQHRGPCGVTEAGAIDGPDFGAFIDCAARVLATPQLHGPAEAVPPGAYRLSWESEETTAEFVLLEATRSDFSVAEEIYRGNERQTEVVTRSEGAYYYQLYAVVGDDRSAGSNVVAVRVESADWEQLDVATLPDSAEQHWLDIHRATLRLAAATGELFAALAMPRHFRTAQATRYAGRLRSVQQPLPAADAAGFDFTEASALSYGALFHPWLQIDGGRAVQNTGSDGVVALGNSLPRIVPGDGVALGVLAGRAWRRGAWIAPANEPLIDVVALTPRVPDSDRQALQNSQINLLRADPRGLLCLSADTLSTDLDLRPINVRRLLILLRRLALRRGTTYVFEPNGPMLRRAVQRSFGVLLNNLFQRGAFAGATAEASYRVVTDDTINTSRDADAGRFFVELRVAPSLPMRFIAVRLIQDGDRLSVVEEL